MEIRSRKWHPETCRTFGLQADMLAEIKSNAEIFGHVKEGPLKGGTGTVSVLFVKRVLLPATPHRYNEYISGHTNPDMVKSHSQGPVCSIFRICMQTMIAACRTYCCGTQQ